MSGKKIIDGLKEAIAFTNGDKSKARVTTVRVPKRRKCAECGKHYADYPSDLCPGCFAYQEHTR